MSQDETQVAPHPLMTVQETASALRVHPRTITRLLESGRLDGVRIGHVWRIRRAAVEALLGGDPELWLDDEWTAQLSEQPYRPTRRGRR